VLSVEDVLERLSLSLLRRGTEDRHGTLQAALEWSWELLTDAERAALAQLSVFSGGFTLQAAEAALSLDGASALDTVSALVDRSMLRIDGERRGGMLLTVQEFAASKLGGDTSAALRHGAHFARWGDDDALERLDGPDGPGVRHRMAPDLENLLAACRAALARGEQEVAARTLLAAWAVVQFQGPYLVIVELGRAAAALPGLTASLSARVAMALGTALRMQARSGEAIALFEAAVPAASSAGLRRFEGSLTASLGILYFQTGRSEEAVASYAAAMALARETRTPTLEGYAQLLFAQIALADGELPEASALLALAEPLLTAAQDPVILTELLATRAELLWRSGAPDGGQATLARAEALLPGEHAARPWQLDRVAALLDGEQELGEP